MTFPVGNAIIVRRGNIWNMADGKEKRMANIRPFSCIRPCREKAGRIAALPYDVYNAQEARQLTSGNPDSF
ncbi:hypothetical protein C823_000803 [Eubacterium plexicaudatum ASF492]|nr:hypothetical protein C823_000803 [Eubacterium plexicaudatum ASF492]